MQDNEAKVMIAFAICAGLGISAFPISNYFIKKKQIEADIKKAEIEGQYPPEYWAAKEAESKANAEIEKAKIESDERLVIDLRNRDENERAKKREFEMNAPSEYWEQKKVEEEEITKRRANDQRYKAEVEAAKQHQQTIESGIRAAERAVRNNFTTA